PLGFLEVAHRGDLLRAAQRVLHLVNQRRPVLGEDCRSEDGRQPRGQHKSPPGPGSHEQSLTRPVSPAAMRRRVAVFSLAALPGFAALAWGADTLGPETRKYVRVGAPRVVLEHVEVIDGTGAAPLPDRNIAIEDGKIAAISAGGDEPAREGTTILDLRGYSVMPGIVGMHNHLFYLARPNYAADGTSSRPALFTPMTFSAPRLYLANGVTTMRTAGSIEPQAELKLKRAIEGGAVPGPHLDVTGPYLDGAGVTNFQIRELTGPEDARQTVAYW